MQVVAPLTFITNNLVLCLRMQYCLKISKKVYKNTRVLECNEVKLISKQSMQNFRRFNILSIREHLHFYLYR